MATWKLLMIYVRGRILNGIESTCVDSEACVIINEVDGKWFKINSRIRQGCVMPRGYYIWMW